MRFKFPLVAFGLLLMISIDVSAATLKVPFHLKRNVVIIPTVINGSEPLDLILDSGMGFDGVYIFKEKFLEKIDSSKIIQVRVPGAGSGEPSTALMIENGVLSFGDVTVDSQRVIISTSWYTQNFPSDGVIGWNLFGHYTVKIDYDSEMITLYDYTDFIKPDTGWHLIPITLNKNTPFFNARLAVDTGDTNDIIVYIDLAAREALELLTGPDKKYRLPDSLQTVYLGTGLSGDFYGKRGTSRHMWLGEFKLSNLTTVFVEEKSRSKIGGADAIVGNDYIRRFNIIFDYPNNRLFIRPSKYFGVPFE